MATAAQISTRVPTVMYTSEIGKAVDGVDRIGMTMPPLLESHLGQMEAHDEKQ
jgi:hypothetical protein